jgi:predicted nucleotidyltransferase component of viral defense system
MTIVTFNNIPATEKASIYRQISNKTGIPVFAVEKDWWVVQTLSVIFEMEVAQHLVFKGGTSLSKAWRLIERFSEDIDLAIDREFFGFTGDLGKNQRDKLRKTTGTYIDKTFFPELKARFEAKGLSGVRFELEEGPDSDRDRKINLYYPYVIEPPGYLQPRVQIEIGCRSLREPFTVQTFESLVDETYPGAVFIQPAVNIPTVNPERTFLEKIFLLHEEFQRPSENRRVERLSRHLYDVVKLSKTEFAVKALSDPGLYATIVDHRYKFTRVGWVNYNLHQPQTINPLPVPEVMDAWKADYNTMIEQMIYEENPPSFDQIISELTELKNKINLLPWKFTNEYPVPFS